MSNAKQKGGFLSVQFYNRPTLRVARELLGKFLVRRKGKCITQGMIIDVEAYVGSNDQASHASRGKTGRAKVMFGKAGRWYVYLVYGMHCCLNIVTEKEHEPAAVLIRGVASEGKRINGPGRVTKFFGIDKTFNEKKASSESGLWIEDRGVTISPRSIKRGKRIGVDYAGKWKEKLWRFTIEVSPL